MSGRCLSIGGRLWLPVVFLLLLASCNDSYRITRRYNTHFLLPPGSNLEFGNDGKPKGNGRYQSIYIQGLSSNYEHSLAAIARAPVYRHNDRNAGNCERTDSSCFDAPFAKVRGDFHSLWVNIDLDTLLVNIPDSPDADELVTARYTALANWLATSIYGMERHYGWAQGITQNILEEVFSLIPVPQDAALARYAGVVSDKRSVVLLSPAVFLRVDKIQLFSDPGAQQGDYFHAFNYYLNGQYDIHFFRDRAGKIKQSPFLRIENGQTMPHNSLVSNRDTFSNLQASSLDIQLSTLTQKTFIGLYQDFLKRNNDKSDKGLSTANDIADEGIYDGGSVLLFSNNLNDVLGYPNNRVTRASFGNPEYINGANRPGCRSVITPMIVVTVDRQPQAVILGTTLGQVIQRFALPRKGLKHYRVFDGEMTSFRDVDETTILLPGDKIVSKK